MPRVGKALEIREPDMRAATGGLGGAAAGAVVGGPVSAVVGGAVGAGAGHRRA